jgi:hypothetical protein
MNWFKCLAQVANNDLMPPAIQEAIDSGPGAVSIEVKPKRTKKTPRGVDKRVPLREDQKRPNAATPNSATGRGF